MPSLDIDEAAISPLEAFSQDCSETPRQVLFVLGPGDGAAAEVFRELVHLPHSSVAPHQLKQLVASSRRP